MILSSGVLTKISHIYNERMSFSLSDLRGGDPKAFEIFFDSCYDQLCNYAFSYIKDMNEAEDVVQKSFIKLWDSRENLEIKGSVLSYLYRMVHNECLDTIERDSKMNKVDLEHANQAIFTSSDNVNESLEYTELSEAIDVAIAGLPPQCRRVFELSRKEQLTYNEISNELSISVSTVENHIAKALKILRENLKEFLFVIILISSKLW